MNELLHVVPTLHSSCPSGQLMMDLETQLNHNLQEGIETLTTHVDLRLDTLSAHVDSNLDTLSTHVDSSLGYLKEGLIQTFQTMITPPLPVRRTIATIPAFNPITTTTVAAPTVVTNALAAGVFTSTPDPNTWARTRGRGRGRGRVGRPIPGPNRGLFAGPRSPSPEVVALPNPNLTCTMCSGAHRYYTCPLWNPEHRCSRCGLDSHFSLACPSRSLTNA